MRNYKDTAAALRILGRRDDVHPNDVVAFVASVPDLSPVRWGGDPLPYLGAEELEGGEWLSVYDLRNQIRSNAASGRGNRLVTDPAEDDDYPHPLMLPKEEGTDG